MLPLAAGLTSELLLHAPATAEPGAAQDLVDITVTLDFGEDLGQNFGTLFEARDAAGRARFGAGFLGAYNTYFRADRFMVQFYVRPQADVNEVRQEPLARPWPNAGTYLFDYDGKVYSDPRIAARRIYSWDPAGGQWNIEENFSPDRMRVGAGLLEFQGGRAVYNGRPILLPPSEGRYHGFYYAEGRIHFYHSHKIKEKEGYVKVSACPWRPGQDAADLSKSAVINARLLDEFPYAWGQLEGKVLTVSNRGGIYVYDGSQWSTLREPLEGVSYQVYSAINYHDRIILGQYPTGELFEFDGGTVKHLAGQPPRIQGVRPNAREAQTTVIYRGDLWVGVWPWAEVWRLDRDAGKWHSLGRMFTHPPVTDKTTHPYETECTTLNLVLNLWGQRVTSMVPLGDSLLVSTSPKGPLEWDPQKYPFVADDDKWKEYGQVYRLTMPGHLCASVKWTGRPVTLRFVIARDTMRIVQDGEELGAAAVDHTLTAGLTSAKMTWAAGTFGPLQAALLSHRAAAPDSSIDPSAISEQATPE